MGGGIFAKTAKTPPLQSGVCGDFIAIRIAPKGRPLMPPCAHHAAPHPPMSPYGFYNDAARASLSASTPFPLIIARRPQGLDGWRYAHNGSPAWGVNDGRCSNPPNDLPAMPTVGAGSSRSFAKIPPPTAIYV